MGVELIAAANDTPQTNAQLRAEYDLPFTILSDPQAETARAYGAFHENEPRGRSIALTSTFLIGSSARGGTVLWEYVGPTSRHRVTPSRLSEEIQRALGRTELVVSVIVPSPWQVERVIAGLQQPPLGLYRTPEEISHRHVLLGRDYVRELAMQSNAEVHRLIEEGWTLVAVSPESEGTEVIGQRYVFRRSVAARA